MKLFIGINRFLFLFSQWNLVCGEQDFSELTQTLIILGQGVGAATLTTFADKYGRKPVHIISHICILVLGLTKAFATNFYMFAPLRFLTGVAQQVRRIFK